MAIYQRKILKIVFLIFTTICVSMLLTELFKEFIRIESQLLSITIAALTASTAVFFYLTHGKAAILKNENPSETEKEVSPHQVITELLQDQELFSIVFDTIPVGLWILDETGEIIYVNESGRNLWGGAKYVSPGEYSVYRAWFVNSGKFIEAEEWAAVRALRYGETSINEEIKIERFDGSNRIVLNSALPLYDGDKNIIGVLVVNQDISERKKNEDELIKLSKAVENSPAITTITEPDATIVFVNEMFCKITGYEKEEILGKNPRLLNAGEHSKEFYRNLWKTIKSGSIWQGEFLNRKKNGDLYWEYASISPILDRNKKINYFVKVGVDITLRKKAESELFSTKERLEFLVSSSPVVIYTAKPGNRFEFTYVSSNSSNIIGYRPEELTDDTGLWYSRMHPDDKDLACCDFLCGQEYYSIEYRVRINDGNYYWFRDDKKVIYDDIRMPVQIVGSIINIHDRKKAEENVFYRLKLEKVLNKISAAFAGCPDTGGTINMSLELLTKSIAAGSCYMFEYDHERELVNCRYEWTSAGITPFITRLQNLPADNAFDWWITRMKLDDCLVLNNVEDLPQEAQFVKEILRSYNIVSVLAVPLFCMGKLYGYINFNSIHKLVWKEEDIDVIKTAGDIISRGIERKQYEKILSENEARFRTLVENVGEGVGIVDEHETFTFANPTAHKIFGTDQLIGRSLREFISDEQFMLVMNETESRKQGRVSEYEMEINSAGKLKKNILVTSSPRFLENGSYSGAFGVFRDITERKILEKSLHDTLQKEKELSELKSRFISTASHEFRTPLTTILTSAELLEMFGKKWPEEKYYEHLNKIQNSVHNLTDIINDVLAISRVEKDKLELNPSLINLKDICLEVINEVSQAYNGTIKFLFLARIETAVADQKLLKLFLKNLLGNALKYSREQDFVKFIVASKNDHLYFAVADKGIGIPQKDQSRLFEPFFRAENSTDFPGTGLGLSIVKHAVEKHNGTITFKSRLNKGTAFLVKIPYKLK